MLQSRGAQEEARLMFESQRQAWENLRGQSLDVHQDKLNELIVRTPSDGVIVQSSLSVGERIEPLTPLLSIANTRKLWAVADVRQQEWSLLQIPKGTFVEFTSPVIGLERFQGKLLYTASDIGNDSQSLPLVIEIDSEDPRLRAGLYLTIAIADGNPFDALAVPEAAIVDHEGKSYVFVEEGPRQFRARLVKGGTRANGWVAIAAGLQAEERIVVTNAFVLKSMWLLERDEE